MIKRITYINFKLKFIIDYLTNFHYNVNEAKC